uniref:Vitellogenin 1 n=1 Tax=Colaphellus bowringi TaxID=561076 RepID=A0A182BF83_9CUCU|nr:vitellogenin 1 [Colaphellus bowringi]
MWSQVVFCLLVGLALGSNTPGWKDNTEYVYKVRGRTLASIDEVSSQYSGILLRATLRIQTRPDGKLHCVITKPEYSQIHSQLHDGWKTFIPDSELTWKPLVMSDKPFQVEMKYGVITDVIVNKHVSNWEANVIRGIMSQFQLNTSAAKLNSLSENQQESAVFRIMEDTVTGNTDTLYEIKQLPEYMLQSKPWEARHLQWKTNGDIIEVVKHKNYTDSVELPAYFFGFEGLKNWYPATNQMGEFFIRDSMSRAILTGTLKRFTIHNSYTVNRIMVNPTLTDKQKGSVISLLNVTLIDVKSQEQILEEIYDPVRLGNLVYSYETPYTHSEVREKKPYQTTEEWERDQRPAWQRLRRSIYSSDEESFNDVSEESYKREFSSMSEAPEWPFLPFTSGYKGKSIKFAIDIVNSVEELTREIAKELQDPVKTLEQSSASKFVTLTSLIRIMNEEELKKVSHSLYTTVEEGIKYDTWVIFRDAVAESGTAPAFRLIQSWIKTDKINGQEASHILSTMTKAVRYPTPQFMKAYFELIKSHEVRSEWPLNSTAVLSYADLVHKVYFNKEYKKQFPTKSFTNLRTKEGIQFVRKTFIPYLTQQLHEAISQAETQKIHTYIRALGNVGEPSILLSFEPYLEGKKQCSQYQRLLMLISLDTLVRDYPDEVRPVLFRIYQNPGETQELRVAAVYLLIQAQPTTEMLQFMASYTNVDTQEYVNAAVTSSIRNAANLRGAIHRNLHFAAIAAEPLLTKKVYGLQYGSHFLRSYFVEELKTEIRQALKTWGSDDQYYPKGFQMDIFTNWGGLRSKLAHVQAMISSVEELVRVGEEKTLKYQQRKQKQEENAEEQAQYPWSSQNIASILNMKPEIREQLEGSIYFGELGSIIKMFSFDNQTFDKLPEIIRMYEQEFEKERKVNYLKLVNRRDLAVSFPIEMGLPFLYTYDTPAIVRVQGKVRAAATPEISQGGKLYAPERVNFKSDMFFTVASKEQGRLSFTTPFDHQQYVAGYDKHWQIHVPLKSKVEIDVKNVQMKVEIEPKEAHHDAQLFHYSSWPYTSKADLLNFGFSQINTHVILPREMRRFDVTLGQRQTGLALRVRMDYERRSFDSSILENLFSKQGLQTDDFFALWDNAAIHYSHLNVTYLPNKSTTRKIVMKFGYQGKYAEEGYDSSSSEEITSEKIMQKVGTGIKNARIEALDASVEFKGERDIKYTLAGAFGKSNVHPKSRMAVLFKMNSNDDEFKPWEAHFESESRIPNTGAFDLNEALETEPEVDTKVEFSFGHSGKPFTKIQADIEHRRSEERKQHLKGLPMYLQCKHEMRDGNKQLPACVNATMESNLLDHIKVKVQYENLSPAFINAYQNAMRYVHLKYWLTFEESRPELSLESNEMVMEARFHPDLKFVNVSVESPLGRSFVRDIAVSDVARRAMVVHPVFHLKNRLFSKALELHTFRPSCVVDKTKASTFNNLTYPIDISKHWTVMFQYVPKLAQRHYQQEYVEEQLNTQTNNYVVLVRKNSESKQWKDVKITLSTPQTESKLIDITMMPRPQVTSGIKALVKVAGQEIEVSQTESYDFHNGYIQIYALPTGEVKVEVYNTFYIIYDGMRVRLTMLNGQLKNDLRGLCGQFNELPTEDFFTPQNCFARDPTKFVRSYEVEGHQGKEARKELAENRQECFRKITPIYADVISEIPARPEESEECEFTQTKYVQEGEKICFTTTPVLTCSRQCQAHGYLTKNVPVHCLAKSNIALLWKSQIDKGLSPNFSQKGVHKKIQMQVPQGCYE